MKKIAIMAGLMIAGAAVAVIAGEGGRRHGWGREGREHMLEKYDANKNGVLDPEEKDKAREDHAARREAHRARRLEKFDANKNGTFEPEERAAMRKEHEARRAEALKEFDANGDGKLDDAEREALRAKMRERHSKPIE